MCAKRYEVQAPLVPHDALLPPPDELTDLFINHIWRRFVGGLLAHFAKQVDFIGTDPEIEQAQAWYDALILDFYTIDSAGGDVEYLGVSAGNTTTFSLLSIYVPFSFDDVTTFPLHDVGGFTILPPASRFTVPVGGAGYYACFALAQIEANVGLIRARLMHNISTILTARVEADPLQLALRLSTVAFFDEGDTLELQLKVSGGARATFIDFENPYSLQMRMYRVGIVP